MLYYIYIPLVVAACRGAASLRRGAVLVVLGMTELTHCILDIADRDEDAIVAYMRGAHAEYLENRLGSTPAYSRFQ